MKWSVAIGVFAIGCGGSSKQAPPRQPSAFDQVEKERPASPYEVRSVHGFTAPTTCGQGPYRIETAALGAKFGEELEVDLCAPRLLEGDYRLIVKSTPDDPRHFGEYSEGESKRCKPTGGELAQAGGATSGGTVAGHPAGASSAKASSTAKPETQAIALVPIKGDVQATCPAGTVKTEIIEHGAEGVSDNAGWAEGTALVVEVWSKEPLDLDGATFVVIQRAVRADMTLQGWTAYHAAMDSYRAKLDVVIDQEVKAGRATVVDQTPQSETPPAPRVETKPPSPSAHAEWIPGFWQRQGEWIWSAGFWRVPEADIKAEQTAQAPIAPPPLKAETPPPIQPSAPVVTTSATATVSAPVAAPAIALVWTPGYWAWSGSAYIWIEGAWRAPPQVNARWVAPTWTTRARGRVVLAPGGWSITIGH